MVIGRLKVMKQRKEIKNRAKELYLEGLEQKKNRKTELSSMTTEEAKAAIKADKEASKAAKKARKNEIKGLPKKEQKEAKKLQKYVKKYQTRVRRYTIWGAVAVLLLFVIIQSGPYVGDIIDLMSIDVNSNNPISEQLIAEGEDLGELIADEGMVLLKNDDLLPLTDLNVNVFGMSAVNFRMGGGGSGGADSSRAVSFFDGLQNAGISYNESLYQMYLNMGVEKEQASGMGQVLKAFMGGNEDVEPSIEYLTQDVIDQAKKFSDTAIVVLSNISVEATDSTIEELQLDKNQRDLIDTVASSFDHVIIIVNAGNARELGFINEYASIQAVLWVGTPGPRGANSIGEILTGAVNPSGRLVDTYVYRIEDHPAVQNFGDYGYENLKGMHLLEYEEGIYVGYRYFETLFANDEAGYRECVQFPFGYGLSYTSFDWEVVGKSMDLDNISIDVQVTNTGDYAGKDVVQLYFSPPYYEGGIEKSAIELAEYAKTSLLAPGESEVLTITFATRDMSSYDDNSEKAYALEAGTYEIHISKNVHESIIDIPFEVAEAVVYHEDEATGTQITNQFDYAEGDLTYLSRTDWEGTFPTADDMNLMASDATITAYTTPPAVVEGAKVTMGADNGIMLKNLAGLDYDDPLWDSYLDQFTLKEMITLINNGGWRTVAIDRLGLPETVLLDGPAGLNFFFKATTAAAYPTEVVIASTWNDDLAYAWGETVGKAARAMGVEGWYAPAMNVHRSPLGGRNFEYFSEDPLLSGKMSASAVQGAQSQNIIVFLKHFALNEQEINARSGVMVWANEQAIREIYLRPFEIAVKEGDAKGVMSSFILIGPKWSGGNPELLQNVLRDEWGFDGIVSTDAVLGGFMNVNLAIRGGNELMLSPVPTGNERKLTKLYKKDPVGVAAGLRERTHTICYTFVNYSNIFE
jgi:beta-glucosidase